MGWFERKHTREANLPLVRSTQEQFAAEIATVDAVMHQSGSSETIHFGAPTRCPRCAKYGFVESINPTTGACHNHCFECRNDWVITLRAIRAHAAGETANGDRITPWQATLRGTPVFVEVEPDLTVETTAEVADEWARRYSDDELRAGVVAPATEKAPDGQVTRFA